MTSHQSTAIAFESSRSTGSGPARSPPTRYSSTSPTPAGTSTAIRRARLPGSIVPKSAPNPSARAPSTRRALEQRARRHRRRQRAHRRQLGEQVQIRRARQAVGADRDAHAGRVEVLDRRRAGAGVPVAARTGDERRAARAQPRQIVARHLHAVHGEHARVEKAAVVEILHRATPGATHAASQAPSSSSSARHGPPPVRDELDFLGRLRRGARCRARTASRSTALRIARNTSGATEYGACAARLARTRSVGAERRRSRAARASTTASASGALKPKQLVEDDGRQRARARAARTSRACC